MGQNQSGSHIKLQGVRCSHLAYRMSCEQYRDLEARAEGQCGICGGLGLALQIDHDPAVGQWAVRGLLCSPCNTRLGLDSRAVQQERYLGDPWYRTVAIPTPPEPPVGAYVAGPGKTAWMRRPKGWVAVTYRPQMPRCTWQSICRNWGPHNLKIINFG